MTLRPKSRLPGHSDKAYKKGRIRDRRVASEEIKCKVNKAEDTEQMTQRSQKFAENAVDPLFVD